jgi:hypothetical protein
MKMVEDIDLARIERLVRIKRNQSVQNQSNPLFLGYDRQRYRREEEEICIGEDSMSMEEVLQLAKRHE